MLSDHLPDEVSTALHRIYTASLQNAPPLFHTNTDSLALIRRLRKASQ